MLLRYETNTGEDYNCMLKWIERPRKGRKGKHKMGCEE